MKGESEAGEAKLMEEGRRRMKERKKDGKEKEEREA